MLGARVCVFTCMHVHVDMSDNKAECSCFSVSKTLYENQCLYDHEAKYRYRTNYQRVCFYLIS